MMSNLWGFCCYYCCLCFWASYLRNHRLKDVKIHSCSLSLTFGCLTHFVLIHVYKMWMGQPRSMWILNCYPSPFFKGKGRPLCFTLILVNRSPPSHTAAFCSWNRVSREHRGSCHIHLWSQASWCAPLSQLPLSTECCPSFSTTEHS